MTGAVQAGGQKGHLKKCWGALPLLDVSMDIAGGFQKGNKKPRVISGVIRRHYPDGLSKTQQNPPRYK